MKILAKNSGTNSVRHTVGRFLAVLGACAIEVCAVIASLVFVSWALTLWANEPPDVSQPKLDRPTVQRMLRGFHPQGEDLQSLETQLRNLDSAEFLTRDRAMKDLLSRPIVPPNLMAATSQHGSTEVRLAVRRLRGTHSAERIDRLLHSAYAEIIRQRWRGLCSEVLGSLPHAKRSTTLRLGQRALSATVEIVDKDALASSLGDDLPVIRRTAATALAKLLGKDAVGQLLPMVQDQDAKVRLEVAIALANLGRRESFAPLIDLLQHELFAIRWRAGEALVALTGQSFGFRPADRPLDRAASIRQWRSWLADESPTCELRSPIEVPTQLRLFNGFDFTGWLAFASEETEPAKLWEIRNGVLESKTKQYGDLRTRDAFEDYRLSLQWRMPTVSGDSGIGVALVDASSNQPVYLEVQLHPNNSGDLYVLGGMSAKSGGEPIGYRAVKWRQSNERYRQWNEMEIVVSDGNVVVAVNGELQNRASQCPREPSHILIRNEGSMIQFRNVMLEPLE